MDSVVRLPTPRTRHQAWLQRWRRLWQLLVAKASGFYVVVSVLRCARLVLVRPKGPWGLAAPVVRRGGVYDCGCAPGMPPQCTNGCTCRRSWCSRTRGGGSCPFWFRSCWRRHGRSMSTGGPSRYAPCMSSPAVCGPGMGSMRGGAITAAACGCPVSKISIEVLLFLFARSAGGIQK